LCRAAGSLQAASALPPPFSFDAEFNSACCWTGPAEFSITGADANLAAEKLDVFGRRILLAQKQALEGTRRANGQKK